MMYTERINLVKTLLLGDLMSFRFVSFASILLLPTLLWACFVSVDVDVTLSPAGQFSAKTNKVSGKAFKVNKNGKEYVQAKNIIIDVNSLSTGISLRDKHLKERLLSDKHPTAKLLKATGTGGKGIALLEIKGKKIKVSGKYTISGEKLKASFPLKLEDLDITDVRYMGVGVKDTVTVNVVVPVIAPVARIPANRK